ncbi:MAG: PilZ domain-containing protein [Phycisphaerae bacterium]|nr:PilZ domain-containing protein [Phycisphaerae bacterium]
MVNIQNEQLARQHERHHTSFRARVEPHGDHAAQIRLSFPDAFCGLEVIDVSSGGLGLKSSVFIPRNLRINLHISDVSAGDDVATQVLNIRAVVRRCLLVDHKPTYQVGLQFLNPKGNDEQALVKAASSNLSRVKSTEPEASREPVGAGGARGT